MPKYLGRGEQFYLIICEHTPFANMSKEQKIANHEKYCNRCGFFKDAVERQKKAIAQGKTWRRLICIHPTDKATLEKFKPHVTVWAK
jgi:hypothetical protein